MRYFCVSLLVVSLFAPASSAAFSTKASRTEYASALSTADKILFAWKSRDAKAALALLSPKGGNSHPPEDIPAEFVGLSNPHHECFEILSGKRLSPGRYSFSFRRYEDLTGSTQSYSQPAAESLIVSKRSSGRWTVDLFGSNTPPPVNRSKAKAMTPDYLHALSGANQILNAWQAGVASLYMPPQAPRLPKTSTRKFIHDVIKGRHLAYEIGSGLQTGDARFSFPVRLYEGSAVRSGKIVLSKDPDSEYSRGDDIWRIEALP